jgi:hypothetical protein
MTEIPVPEEKKSVNPGTVCAGVVFLLVGGLFTIMGLTIHITNLLISAICFPIGLYIVFKAYE